LPGAGYAPSVEQRIDFGPGFVAQVMRSDIARKPMTVRTESHDARGCQHGHREENTYLYTCSHLRHYDQRHAPGSTEFQHV
jgi:hypothetical protein